MTKAEIAVDAAWERNQLTQAEIEEYEERRAILEIDAGMDAFAADIEARRICMARWANASN